MFQSLLSAYPFFRNKLDHLIDEINAIVAYLSPDFVVELRVSIPFWEGLLKLGKLFYSGPVNIIRSSFSLEYLEDLVYFGVALE